MISPTSIYVALFTFFLFMPKVIHFIASGKGKILVSLFKFPTFLFFILEILSGIAATVLALLYSHGFNYNGWFFTYTFFCIVFGGAYFILYIVFISHGYDPRYLFAFIKIPAPFTILAGTVLILGAALTLNYYMLIAACVFTVSSFLVDFKGYKETRPKVDLNQPVPPDDFDKYS